MVMPDTLLYVRNGTFEETLGSIGVRERRRGFGASGGRESAAVSRSEASETERFSRSLYSRSLDRFPRSTIVMPRAVLRVGLNMQWHHCPAGRTKRVDFKLGVYLGVYLNTQYTPSIYIAYTRKEGKRIEL